MFYEKILYIHVKGPKQKGDFSLEMVIIIIIYSLNFPYLRVLALSICPNRTVSSVLNIYQFMCPMPTILNMSEKS